MSKFTKKVYCTLDTETLGGATNPMNAYQLSGIIHDRIGGPIASYNYIVAEKYDQIRDDDYHKTHFDDYEHMVKTGTATMVATLEDAVNAVCALCDYYNVDTVMAFNASFDLIKGVAAPLLEGRDFIDLWLMACETLATRKDYSDFCHKHGLQSRSLKSCASSAEAFYRYITNDPYFEERHTAFADAMIEMEIFLACLRTHKKFTKNEVWYNAKGFKYVPKW